MNYNIIIGIFLISLVVLKVNNKIDISGTVLGIITIITVLMLKSKNNLEFLQTNEEVLATIASIYNKDNMTVTNLKVTGKLDVDGAATIAGATNINGLLTTPSGINSGNIKSTGTLEVDKLATMTGGIKSKDINLTGYLWAGGYVWSNDYVGSPKVTASNEMTFAGNRVMRYNVGYDFVVAGMKGGYIPGENPGSGGRYLTAGGGKYVIPATVSFS